MAIISIDSTFLLYVQPFTNPDSFIAFKVLWTLENLTASGQHDGLPI